MKHVESYQIIDHGIEHSQFFQGCGTSFTEFTDCATGIGATYYEALDDALEMLAQSGEWDVEALGKWIKADLGLPVDQAFPEDGECVPDGWDENYWHVSIRVK